MISKERREMFGESYTRAEIEAWRKVCKLLRETDAVTEADLNSRVTDDHTPGQRLFAAIRDWADNYASMQVSDAEAKMDKRGKHGKA